MVDHHEEVSPATVVPALQARPDGVCQELTKFVYYRPAAEQLHCLNFSAIYCNELTNGIASCLAVTP